VATVTPIPSSLPTPTLAFGLAPETIDQLADAVADRLQARLLRQPIEDGWLDTAAAASYLGITATALHKLTSARQLAFSQAAPGGRCFFRRADLDAFREESMKGG
jgi:hypothetical protein